MNVPANLQDALPFILLGLALLVALWVMYRASRKTKVIGETEGDVLDEGAGPASRNQALIDAEPAATHDTGALLNASLMEEPAAPVETTAQTASAPAPEPAPETPAPQPAPQPAKAAKDTPADDLKRIKGLGPKLVKILAEQGVTRFEQIAAWSDADVAKVDASLGRFAGRITRDAWVEQARLLAAGDEDNFNKTFGNNG